MNKQQAYAWGIFCSFFSAFSWGTSHISGRWRMSNQYIDIISLCSIRYTFGGLTLLLTGAVFSPQKNISGNFSRSIDSFVAGIFRNGSSYSSPACRTGKH